jgi:hypothetical protein
MKQYRLYALNKHGRIVGPANIIQADTDEDAIAEAKRLQTSLDVELREDARFVTTLRAGAR